MNEFHVYNVKGSPCSDIFGDEELVHPLRIPDFFHRLSNREEHGKHGHDRFASISIENDPYREMHGYSDI